MEEPFTTASETATLDEFRRELNPNTTLYTSILTIVFLLALFSVSICWYFIFDVINYSDLLLPVASVGLVIGVVAAGVFRWKIRAKSVQYRSVVLLNSSLLLLGCGFLVSLDGVLIGNEWFDFSTPIDHTVLVLDKTVNNLSPQHYYTWYHRRRYWDHWFFRVTSWHPNKSDEWINVRFEVFNKVPRGDSLIVATKSGAFGIEYHVK